MALTQWHSQGCIFYPLSCDYDRESLTYSDKTVKHSIKA